MNKKAIGKKLYSLRTNFGKSREEVAKDIGVSVSALHWNIPNLEEHFNHVKIMVKQTGILCTKTL